MADIFEVRIRADKTGPEPAQGEPWPCAGVELVGELRDEVKVPASFVRRFQSAPWLKTTGVSWVDRPSQPNPDEKDGVLVPPKGQMPLAFMHVSKLTFDTLNHGKVTYRVTRQPDKYVADSDDPTQTVTREDYDSGNVRSDFFYTCVREG